MVDITTLRTCFAAITALNDDGVAFFGPSFSGEGTRFDASKLQVEVVDLPCAEDAVPKVGYRVTRIFQTSNHLPDYLQAEWSRWIYARTSADPDPRLPTLRQAIAMQRLPESAFPQPNSLVSYHGVACTVHWTAMSKLRLRGLGLDVEVPLHTFLIEKGVLPSETP